MATFALELVTPERMLFSQEVKAVRAPGVSGGSHVLAYAQSASGNEAAALYGSPGEIARKLDALREAGVHYVLASMGGGSRDSLRRFARELMPGYAAA